MQFLLLTLSTIFAFITHETPVVSESKSETNNYGVNMKEGYFSNSYMEKKFVNTVTDTSTGYSITLDSKRDNIEIIREGNIIKVKRKRSVHDKITQETDEMTITVTKNSIADISMIQIEHGGDYKTVLKIEFENPHDYAVVEQTEFAARREDHLFTNQ